MRSPTSPTGCPAGAAPDLAGLIADLRALSLPPGDVLVHASLRAVGRPTGGPATVLAALRDVLGADATIVVPVHTAGNSTSSASYHSATAGMSSAERACYEAAMPGFRLSDPSQGMGALAEHVRTRMGAVRSAHPQASFAAIGPRAGAYTRFHDLDCHLGERSPLGALYRAGAGSLLLGVGYDRCTSLHLAEYRMTPARPRRAYRCFSDHDGRRVCHDFQALHLDDSDFGRLGDDLEDQPFTVTGRFGAGVLRYTPIRPAVDFAVRWLTENRRP